MSLYLTKKQKNIISSFGKLYSEGKVSYKKALEFFKGNKKSCDWYLFNMENKGLIKYNKEKGEILFIQKIPVQEDLFSFKSNQGEKDLDKVFNNLKFDFNKIGNEKQMLKVSEEFGEVVKSFNKKEAELGFEMADLMISVYGLSKIMNIDLNQKIQEKIEIINKRKK